ncbi:MAG TPA: bifunctional histidinol-phosphatase/imidazoleglycerol-phosphate dehydratase [Bacteroidetes bacterium]|nr:bifunctional histidinol-phosphatase/imidazoleglycerol-phosphate dehydratase [Bacteroidota bacterium]
MKKVVFLDRDGTIIVEPPDKQIDSLEKLELIPGVIQGLRLLVDRGFELVMITNQDGLGTSSFPSASFDKPQQKLLDILSGEGIRFSEIFICPHMPSDQCDCRKPKSGLLRDYLAKQKIDLAKSFVIGDRETDVQLGDNIGCKTIRLTDAQSSSSRAFAGNILEACKIVVRADRCGHVDRKTNETSIRIDVFLDGTGAHTINTGLGFFDHMLAQLSRHSLIDMSIVAEGDLRVDEHHTVEDTGLAVGNAIRQALGEKRGIERYGFLLPMDESLAQVALDLSGRPYFVFESSFQREKVGDLPTELVEDFFRALTDGLRANLHIKVEGRNDHHKIEAIFKSVARALKQAVAIDERSATLLPTTKGNLS